MMEAPSVFPSAEECLAAAETCERKAQSLSYDRELQQGWLELAAHWIFLAKDAEEPPKD